MKPQLDNGFKPVQDMIEAKAFVVVKAAGKRALLQRQRTSQKEQMLGITWADGTRC